MLDADDVQAIGCKALRDFLTTDAHAEDDGVDLLGHQLAAFVIGFRAAATPCETASSSVRASPSAHARAASPGSSPSRPVRPSSSLNSHPRLVPVARWCAFAALASRVASKGSPSRRTTCERLSSCNTIPER